MDPAPCRARKPFCNPDPISSEKGAGAQAQKPLLTAISNPLMASSSSYIQSLPINQSLRQRNRTILLLYFSFSSVFYRLALLCGCVGVWNPTSRMSCHVHFIPECSANGFGSCYFGLFVLVLNSSPTNNNNNIDRKDFLLPPPSFFCLSFSLVSNARRNSHAGSDRSLQVRCISI